MNRQRLWNWDWSDAVTAAITAVLASTIVYASAFFFGFRPFYVVVIAHVAIIGVYLLLLRVFGANPEWAIVPLLLAITVAQLLPAVQRARDAALERVMQQKLEQDSAAGREDLRLDKQDVVTDPR